MEDQKQRSFTFEIDNFSEKEAEISSPIFESGGCEWFLKIRPKRNYHLDHLCVYLHVANHESLRRGWKIRANYCFITLNQSGNVLLRTSEVRSLFCAEVPAWGVLPLTEAQEKRFLDKNKLIIKVQVKVVEVIHEGKSTENEMADYYGFHILCSQAYSVSQIFVEHPDFALDFRPKEKKRPSFRFEINNFSEKENSITSQKFVGGGCEWYLLVFPKGRFDHNYMSLYLHVANTQSLQTGWKRSAKYYFVVLNQSDKELYRSPVRQRSTLFDAEAQGRAVDGEVVEDVSEKQETVEVNGFQAFTSQVTSVRKKIAEHVVKTEYKTVLSNACTKLSEMAEEGFKLDWLKSKLDEVSLKIKKKPDDVDDGSRVKLLEERIKNLEVMESGSKMDSLVSKFEDISLERKKENSRAKQLEERLKNLEVMELGFKVEYLETKLGGITLEMNKDDDEYEQLEERVKNLEVMEFFLKTELEEISLERKKSDDANRSRFQKYDGRIMDLELKVADLKVGLGLKLECFKSKFEEDCLERKKSDDADESRIEQLEESVQNIELMVSYLKDEMDKKKDKSSADGFMLVD
ncbi:hypothetical protein AALP_AA4G212800 [Arabis alpina]|uniref:MATH domain-containing protein n=1 Tax=Arabis alpina TaxID=50452 RepID=A0A087H4P6_ARAAL|nr:hypothetical protein AALP_AA4G212800 [Arabis alpina]